ncbi:Putrescine transport system permease protein PotI (TC 3.A.1.11.2) [[Actinomadura] parvosata subsp. kistnae]|uniref:ABC transporter permease n=1 Tax=[Actinomadura] parvosata subsp. kistnae TaxID=1909395 RepID=A0A1V0A746_9ACTN|nr:ABC transporter permease [Nonomuraea sp. ATCC 55076]AQZ66024.1 ABC transporter permease [Nonomuraea sp. ATCC 55076]SPL97495.1 Putrescine transport system permease protein PotI (TC 3.A.1.11.2) [Actinomadura parvosata subsp. kistnae]
MRGGRAGDRLLHLYTWLIILWLSSPIAVMILFGFNDKRSKSNTTWQGFTLRWYAELFDISDLTTALANSLKIAVASTVITVVIGTMLGLALGRHRFRGSGVTNFLVFAAISTPELVMGASLLSLFVSGNVPRDSVTIIVAHVLFSLSFVVVTVRARVVTLDPSLEEAARDLGAGAWATFRLVTLPSIMPAVLAGGMLSFALSIDDYVVTSFVNGSTVTFPLWIVGAVKTGIPAQVNVMGTLLFGAGVLIAVGNAVAARRRS